MRSTWVRGIVVVVCALGLAAPSWAEGPLAPANDVKRQVDRVVPADKPGIPNVQSGNEQKASSAPRGESLRPATGVGPQGLRQQQQITNPMQGRDFKMPIKEDLKTVDQQGHGLTDPHGHAVGTRGLGTGNSPFLGGGSADMGSRSLRGPAEKIKEKATITGEKYGDTFGADRINGQNAPPDVQIGGTKGRAPGGFTGGGRGNASEDNSTLGTGPHGGVGLNDKSEGPFKEATGYFRIRDDKDGGHTTILTIGESTTYSSYDKDKNLIHRDTVDNVSGKVTRHEIHPLKNPNPQDNDSPGGPIIVLPGSTPDREIKARMKTRGQAGGPGDGRNPASDPPSAGVPDGSATSIMMGTTHGQEAKQVEPAGSINMDKLLEINTKVNPGSH